MWNRVNNVEYRVNSNIEALSDPTPVKRKVRVRQTGWSGVFEQELNNSLEHCLPCRGKVANLYYPTSIT